MKSADVGKEGLECGDMMVKQHQRVSFPCVCAYVCM